MMVKTFRIARSELLELKFCEVLNLNPDQVISLTIIFVAGDPIIIRAEMVAPENINDIDLSELKAIE